MLTPAQAASNICEPIQFWQGGKLLLNYPSIALQCVAELEILKLKQLTPFLDAVSTGPVSKLDYYP